MCVIKDTHVYKFVFFFKLVCEGKFIKFSKAKQLGKNTVSTCQAEDQFTKLMQNSYKSEEKRVLFLKSWAKSIDKQFTLKKKKKNPNKQKHEKKKFSVQSL